MAGPPKPYLKLPVVFEGGRRSEESWRKWIVDSKPSCLMAPFVALWRLIAWIIQLVGRLLAAVIGLALVIVGIVLSLTVIGAILGIPLIIFGLLLMVRSIY